jgi:NADH:ubiquinone oxidoreductase subunit F (NADH-binding)
LRKITSWETAKMGDIEMLEELAGIVKDTAMCGLGQTGSQIPC